MLSRLAIERPILSWMVLFALIVFGGASALHLGVSELPDVDYPTISVSLSYPGAAPEVMESDVVDIAENFLSQVQGLRRISSTSRNGVARIVLEFELTRSIDAAFQDAQQAIVDAQRRLPREMEPPVISRDNAEDQPVLWLTFSSATRPRREMMRWVRDHLVDRFATVSGVSLVALGGYLDPNMRIWLSSEALHRYQLTATDVIAAIQQQHREPAGGWVADSKLERNVRFAGEATTPEEFGLLPVLYRGGSINHFPVTLSKLARIESSLSDMRRISRVQGEPAIGIAIFKQHGANAVGVGDAVKARVAELTKTLPAGMTLAVNYDNTQFIRESVNELERTLVLSALLTALVCGIFFGSGAATLNILMSIPTSIIGTFLILYFAGFTLNTFTLLALSLAVGIVVDDAIMVMENIQRYRALGHPWRDAAEIGVREITPSAVAASLSLVSIFLPIAFMKGLIGRFFFQFAITMSCAVALSLLEALTLAPMRSSRLTGDSQPARWQAALEHAVDRAASFYRSTLAWTLDRRAWVLGLCALSFAIGAYPWLRMRQELLPSQDANKFTVQILTPVGSAITYTDGKLREIETWLAARPEVARYYGVVGGLGGGETNFATVSLTLKPRAERALSQRELMAVTREYLKKAYPDIQISLSEPATSGLSSGGGFPIDLSLRGPDLEKLAQYAQTIRTRLQATGLVTDLDTNYRAQMPEIRIVPDRARAAERGVAIASIADTLSALVAGVVVGTYPDGAHRSDIRLKLDGIGNSRELPDLKRLYVHNNHDEVLPLADVVTTRQVMSVQSIARQDRERAIALFANVADGKSQAAALAAAERIAKEVLPEEYRLVPSGGSETFRETFQSLWMALFVGIVLSYMILASQFDNLVDPLSILAALPFSATGALWALYLTGRSLNLYSLIGLILLMGIVKKNAILLVDRANQVERAGMSIRSALLDAARTRFRPILMTSIATIAGAIPAALMGGAGSECRSPMAIAVIGGCLFSTLLSLYAVPCLHSVLHRPGKPTRPSHRGQRPQPELVEKHPPLSA